MIKLIAKCALSYNCSSIAIRYRNPYAALTPEQLLYLANTYLHAPASNVGHLNNLILLGLAVYQHPVLLPSSPGILNRCMSILRQIHMKIDEQEQHILRAVQFGHLVQLVRKIEAHGPASTSRQQKIELLQDLYMNTYSHILPLTQQLSIYEFTQNWEEMHYMSNAAYRKIRHRLGLNNLQMQQYVAYLRLFYSQVGPSELEAKLKQWKNGNSLTEAEKQIVCYIAIVIGADYALIQNLQFEPSLAISQSDDPKSICLKLQIIKFKAYQIPSLDLLAPSLHRWSFDNIIWVSEMMENSPKFRRLLHEQLLRCLLPPQSDISSLLVYARNAKISGDMHFELSDWLSKQEGLNAQKEGNICSMLQELNDQGYYKYYGSFFKKVLELSLGKYAWETQNVIYYFSQVWEIEDENLEYLRRYILNNYASLGTARRQIPTTSYFYKILEVTDVKKFYADLWRQSE